MSHCPTHRLWWLEKARYCERQPRHIRDEYSGRYQGPAGDLRRLCQEDCSRKTRHDQHVCRVSRTGSHRATRACCEKPQIFQKNNPAVDFLNRLKDRAPLTDPRRNPYYSFDKYERITIGLNDFSTDDRREMMRRFPFPCRACRYF